MAFGQKILPRALLLQRQELFETIGDAGKMPLPEARSLVEARLAAFGNTKHDSNTPFEVVAEISFHYRGRALEAVTMRTCRDALRRTIQPYFKGKPLGASPVAMLRIGFWGLPKRRARLIAVCLFCPASCGLPKTSAILRRGAIRLEAFDVTRTNQRAISH